MVQFHEHIITDLLEDPTGGLVILSSGLSLPKLVSSLLLLHHPSQGTLLILSPSPSLKSQILHHLKTHHHFSPENHQITEITAELPSHYRLSLYSSGQICFITARILIVDLLTNKIPVTNLSGLILLNVHSLSEASTEAFIARILKTLTQSIYIRAFTDKPHAIVAGFSKTERIMKSLYIKKLHLWPRFQVYVSEELERAPPEVVDVRVPMTKYMLGIQKAIVEVMDACLKEMRKTNKVDIDDLTVENGLFKSFDEIVRRQLDPIWHILGKKTKQLVSDLKTLRKLLDYLVRYDAVSYLKYLDTLRVSESFRSVWIFAESSFKIFDHAKKRVYRLARSNDTKVNGLSKNTLGKKRKLKRDDDNEEKAADGASSTGTNSEVILEEVLEAAPKWKVLREILEEIEEERQKQALSREDLVESEEVDSGIIVVACKDECSCMQLEDFITNGHQKVLREEWEKYLLSKVELRHLQIPQKKKHKPRESKGFGILDGVVPVTTTKNAESTSVNKQEHDALLAAASEIRNRCRRDYIVDDEPQALVDSKHQKGRGKGQDKRGRRKNALNSRNKDDDANNKVARSDKPEISSSERKGQIADNYPAIADGYPENSLKSASIDQGDIRRRTQQPSSAYRNAKQIPPVHFYAQESDQPILDILKPSVIIVYHPDMTFVREIEVYKAENPSKKLKVYFLFYEDSTEVQKFEASIRRENGAFESLIRQKSLMMIPVDQNANCLGLDSSMESQPSSSQNSITRKAGGRKEVEKEMQVIVDMREFMSSLPNVLHQKGMRIIPVTLEVGDYILSPLICVERKSIQDLFMSFTSGRLYHQVETMVRYYRIPVLLIEFSQDKSFSFQSASDIGDDVTPNSIISKLSLLVMHFPRLRIIWSRSLHATAEIFASLKANQDEPDEAKAIRIGVPSEEGIVENDVRAENYNTSGVEFLRRLPGVTDSNYRAIMDGCKSLSELALLPVERLTELMGGQKAARTLRDFLDAKYPTLL
ncbi:DNA repair endonuclease UVH1 isoform X1 [Hevea brasiliensis]|uniref:DNA repair endonuclease UVH1 isoform X1 n=1 Tax=Hevea brasiliensis TaxID=3981 RepID=UPI0025D58134|nr:DNA repair endonuclease UVH1 isoform X1 [Hevea brasiliensis]